MSTALITAVVALLGQLASALGGQPSLITSIINVLVQLIPVVVKEAQDLIPPIKNIIAAVTDSGIPDEQQLATLKALDAQVDAAFEEAAKKWEGGA
jgi:hypothetical protein